MKVTKIGEGKAEYVIVGSVHGDEPCGKKAIERFIKSGFEVEEAVKFIVANEEALEQNVRYLDTDLNRSFPGDSSSENHEEKLASRITEEIKGKKVLDIHSTHSYSDPFGTFSEVNSVNKGLLESTGVENAVLFAQTSGALTEQTNGVVVEAGYQGSEQAVDNAYNVIINFLASEGVIDTDYKRREPNLFQYYDTVEGNWEFLAENFKEVSKGEIYAKREEETLVAEEDFFPVLMSTNGYEGQLGFKARRIEK